MLVCLSVYLFVVCLYCIFSRFDFSSVHLCCFCFHTRLTLETVETPEIHHRPNHYQIRNLCRLIRQIKPFFFSSLPVRCLWAPVNVWMELPAWPTSTCPPAAGGTCVRVSTALKAKGAKWTWMTANRTPADWAAASTAPTRSPASARLERQVWKRQHTEQRD